MKHLWLLSAIPGTDDDDKAFFKLFAFISLLSYDVNIKKQLVEQIIDRFSTRRPGQKKIHKAKADFGFRLFAHSQRKNFPIK